MTALLALLHRAFAAREPLDRGADLELAFAITQLLIDSGRADAAGCVVVATWRTSTQMSFEVICAERIRTPLSGLLARFLARPFNSAAHGWLLSQSEALALVNLTPETTRCARLSRG
jgi:hypothetical protein